LKIALLQLFGINEVVFKRGVVSDASHVFVNTVQHCFPGTASIQCYPHIIRKFMVDDRDVNGGYRQYLTKQDSDWMRKEAETSVRRMHLCRTKAQRDNMWSMTKTRWEADGETKIASTFQKTYIDDAHYSQWWYSVTGHHGCVPCNNPMERHNLYIKGAADFLGQVEIGRDMLTTLTIEFPKLIYHCSTDHAYPCNDIPVLDLK
jgi:hypothetical protein